MVILLFGGGIVLVRLLAALMVNVGRIPRAIIATAIAVGIGFWGINIDWNNLSGSGELMALLNALLTVPVLMGLGTSVMLVTLGSQDDDGWWNEWFQIEDISFGNWEAGWTLIGKMALTVVVSGGLYLFLFAVAAGAVPYVYFGIQGLILLRTLLVRD